MVNLERIMPVDDNELYVKHVYYITLLWLVVTFGVALIFTLFLP